MRQPASRIMPTRSYEAKRRTRRSPAAVFIKRNSHSLPATETTTIWGRKLQSHSRTQSWAVLRTCENRNGTFLGGAGKLCLVAENMADRTVNVLRPSNIDAPHYSPDRWTDRD